MPASPYVIEEIAGLGRGISLRGRSLPYRGVSYAATQRIETTWNPGNPVATEQVEGPTFDDVTINGIWKDIFLFDPANAPALSNFPALIRSAGDADLDTVLAAGAPVAVQEARRAEVAMYAIEQIRKAASPVRIEWGSIVRYGLVHKTNFTFDRIEDITWEITLKISGEQPNQPQPGERREVNVTGDIRALINQILIDRLAEDFPDALGPFDVAQGLINALEGALRKIQYYRTGVSLLDITQSITRLGALVTDLLGTLEGFANLAFFPADVLGTLRATLKGIQLEGELIVQRFASRAAATFAGRSGNPAEVAAAHATQQFLRDRAMRMAADAVRLRRQIEKLQVQTLRTVVLMRLGETLRDVARRAYGAEREWRSIATFNGFSSSIVPAGTLIRVPNL